MSDPNRSAGEIKVNGRQRPFSACSLLELLAELGYSAGTRGIAVALNGEVVPKAAWATRKLQAGDEIEIVGAVQGG